MSEKGKEEFMKKHYLGEANNKDQMSLASQMVEGLNQFKPMYKETTSHRIKTDGTREEFVTKELEYWLHWEDGKKAIVSRNPSEKGINLAILSCSTFANTASITGRTMLSIAGDVMENARKAMAIYKTSPYKEGKLPSGQTWEDYLVYMRKNMYVELEVGKKDLIRRFSDFSRVLLSCSVL